MARYSKKNTSMEKSGEEAMAIARGTQKPGQTKDQTRLIAQGIQKGIELYKKQQAAKKREMDRKIKKAVAMVSHEPASVEVAADVGTGQSNKLAWVLLFLSWIGFGIYFFLGHQ